MPCDLRQLWNFWKSAANAPVRGRPDGVVDVGVEVDADADTVVAAGGVAADDEPPQPETTKPRPPSTTAPDSAAKIRRLPIAVHRDRAGDRRAARVLRAEDGDG